MTPWHDYLLNKLRCYRSVKEVFGSRIPEVRYQFFCSFWGSPRFRRCWSGIGLSSVWSCSCVGGSRGWCPLGGYELGSKSNWPPLVLFVSLDIVLSFTDPIDVVLSLSEPPLLFLSAAAGAAATGTRALRLGYYLFIELWLYNTK